MRVLITVLSILFFATAIFAYNKFFYHSKFTGKEKSIAVLPFINNSSDKENEYFSDGISSEITNQLTKIGSIEVRAWSSSLKFKNSNKSLKEIAEVLNVAAILGGSIQRNGNKIRIHAELTDVNTNNRIWGQEYDRTWGDIFEIQSELAQQIAFELNAGLTKEEKNKIEEKPTENSQAYEYYLQGKQLLEKFRQTLKQEMYDNSKMMFEKAIALDPNYAIAHTGLANLYNVYTDLAKPDSVLSALQVKEIEKAYVLGPDLDYVNSIRGAIFRIVLNNLEESYKSLRRAYEINPNNTTTLFEFAVLLSDLGLFDERVILLQKAVKLDPLNSGYFGFLGGADVHINRLDEGMRDLQTALRLEPDMFYVFDRLAYVYALQNNLKEADSWLQKFLKKIPRDREKSFYNEYGQYSAYCFAKLGDKQKALEISKHWRVYLALGMKEEALMGMFQRQNENEKIPLINDYLIFKTHLPHKDFDIIRTDPSFLELMEKKRIQYEENKKKFSIAGLVN